MNPSISTFDSSTALQAIEAEIADYEAQLATVRSPFARFSVGATFVVAGVAYGFIGPSLGGVLASISLFTAFAVAVSGLFTTVLMEVRYQAFRSGTKSHLEFLKQRKKNLERLSGAAAEPESSYFDSLVRINVDNLAAYYSLVKLHTNKSFNVAVGVGLIGFALITIGLGFGFATSRNSNTLTYISSGAGVITEFIAGVFFYLYNRTVQQMKGYHDSLLVVQNVLLSFKLVGDTREEKEKVRMVSEMLGYLIGRKSLEINNTAATDSQKAKAAEA